MSWTCLRLGVAVLGPHGSVVVNRVLQSLFDRVPALRNAPALCYSTTRRALPYRRENPALGSVLPAHRDSATAFSACVIKINSLFSLRDNRVEKYIRLGALKQDFRVGNACRFAVIGELMRDPSTASIRFADCVQMSFNCCMKAVECFHKLPCRLRWIRLD